MQTATTAADRDDDDRRPVARLDDLDLRWIGLRRPPPEPPSDRAGRRAPWSVLAAVVFAGRVTVLVPGGRCRRRPAGCSCSWGLVAVVGEGRNGRGSSDQATGPSRVGDPGRTRVAVKSGSLPSIAWISDSRQARRLRPRRRRRPCSTDRGLDLTVLPATTTVERPRNPEHGDYASDARARAREEGRDAAAGASRRRSPTSSRRRRGIASVEIAGPGLPQHPARRRGHRRARPDGRNKRQRHTGTATRSPASKINLEFVSANPTGPVHIGGVRWAAVGDALSRLLRAAGAEVGDRVLLQRRRLPDRPVCPIAARRREGRAGAGGRLRRRLHRGHRRHGRRQAPGRARPSRTPQETFRVEGVALMFAEIKSSLSGVRRALRHLLQREGPARPRRAAARARPADRSRATSSRPTARPGCAPPTSATTRTGCCASPTATGPTSPPTAPTTSTSASAASTGS